MKIHRYKDIFQRNIGIYNTKEIKKIKRLKIAIIGAGGLGGLIADSSARLGIQYIRLADPERFDISNINRQQGANIFTIGKNKAKIVRSNITKINPGLKVDVWEHGVDKYNSDRFVKGVDVIFDVIEYFAPECELSIHNSISKYKKWCFSGQVAGSVVSLINYSPNGATFKDMFAVNNKLDLDEITKKLFPILPEGITFRDTQRYLKRKTYIPSYPFPGPILSNLILEQMSRVIIKNKKPICIAPKIFAMDISTLKQIVK